MTAEASKPRAAVAPGALDVIAARVSSGVELVAIGDTLDYDSVDFVVPTADDGSLLDVLPRLSRLSIVQVMSAGTDWIEDRVPPQATLCNARGARDGPVAEWILGALLGATTQL